MKCLLLLAAFLVSASGETLHYSVNWPSGLSLGEVSLRSDRTGQGTASARGWEFELNLDASVPGFAIRDQYHSTANSDLCSEQLDKKVSRGSRKSQERVTFDPGGKYRHARGRQGRPDRREVRAERALLRARCPDAAPVRAK